MAAPPSRRVVKLLPTCSILAVPVVELLADAHDQPEPDEVDLAGARVVADLSRLARPVHEQGHTGVAATEGVRHAGRGRTAHDRASPNRMLHDAALLPEQDV